MLQHLCSNNQFLVFNENTGIGFLPISGEPDKVYDENYFKNYQKITDTEIGRKLNACRIDLVKSIKKESETICDVGIGSGVFCKEFGSGFDINPFAVKWLKENNLFADPFEQEFDYLSFWDVLEHIEDPREILKKAKIGVFISMPIYKSFDHILNSKHLKPNEHVYYFTVGGLCNFMLDNCFELLYFDKRETEIGRDEIGSFFFKRIVNGTI